MERHSGFGRRVWDIDRPCIWSRVQLSKDERPGDFSQVSVSKGYLHASGSDPVQTAGVIPTTALGM